MEFEKLTSEQIDIKMLKSKTESLEHRIEFLEKNWVYWTKNTQETGQRVLIALDQMVKND